jgi:hypothetical protein
MYYHSWGRLKSYHLKSNFMWHISHMKLFFKWYTPSVKGYQFGTSYFYRSDRRKTFCEYVKNSNGVYSFEINVIMYLLSKINSS